MQVEKRAHHEATGYNDGYDWTEYRFDIDGRRYVAEHRLGSGVEIVAIGDARDDDLAAVADYLMLQDGIRHVYHGRRRLRPERPSEPRTLRLDERRLLNHLLAVEDQRVEPLRQQAEHVVVENDAALPFHLELRVPEHVAPPTDGLPDQFAIHAESIREDEDAVTASVWLDGGYLSAIEIDWYVNEPRGLPAPEDLRPAKLR
jgi:hypothetical protein